MFPHMTEVEKTLENFKDTSKVYEVGYLFLPTLSEENLGEEVAFIRGIIEKNGGEFISEDFPKRRVLAYEMSKVIETKRYKYQEAYFGWVKFEIDGSTLANIKKDLEAHTNILRFLLINTVRENTLYFPKVSGVKKEGGVDVSEISEEESEIVSNKTPASAEEIDKSIEALVI